MFSERHKTYDATHASRGLHIKLIFGNIRNPFSLTRLRKVEGLKLSVSHKYL